jgi:hypothetical protein
MSRERRRDASGTTSTPLGRALDIIAGQEGRG